MIVPGTYYVLLRSNMYCDTYYSLYHYFSRTRRRACRVTLDCSQQPPLHDDGVFIRFCFPVCRSPFSPSFSFCRFPFVSCIALFAFLFASLLSLVDYVLLSRCYTPRRAACEPASLRVLLVCCLLSCFLFIYLFIYFSLASLFSISIWT